MSSTLGETFPLTLIADNLLQLLDVDCLAVLLPHCVGIGMLETGAPGDKPGSDSVCDRSVFSL